MKQYPNLFLTLSLICLLLPPFLLKTLYPTLEPYPAVILPAGSDTIDIENSKISFVKTSVLARSKTQAKSLSKLDSEKFIEPIPIHYLKYMALTSFGFKSEPAKASSIWKQKYDSILSDKITSAEIAETKNWFKQRLNQLGYMGDRFMVVSEEIVFDINTGKVRSKTTIDEKIFSLD